MESKERSGEEPAAAAGGTGQSQAGRAAARRAGQAATIPPEGTAGRERRQCGQRKRSNGAAAPAFVAASRQRARPEGPARGPAQTRRGTAHAMATRCAGKGGVGRWAVTRTGGGKLTVRQVVDAALAGVLVVAAHVAQHRLLVACLRAWLEPERRHCARADVALARERQALHSQVCRRAQARLAEPGHLRVVDPGDGVIALDAHAESAARHGGCGPRRRGAPQLRHSAARAGRKS